MAATFLEALIQSRWPSARVRRDPGDDTYTVSIRVPEFDIAASGCKGDAARLVLERLTPRRLFKRRLHWGRHRRPTLEGGAFQQFGGKCY
jgi:hypothetical protein